MKNKLMAAVIAVTVGGAWWSTTSTIKTQRQLGRALALMESSSVTVDQLETNHLALLEMIQVESKKLRDLGNQVKYYDEKNREAIGNLNRDYDKMYTNIIMFGTTVFAARNDIADLAVRLQDVERVQAPAVLPANGR